MAKVTISEAVAAVQAADSKEVVQAVLERCTKAVMVQVYESVTGYAAQFKKSLKSLKKAELAQAVAGSIQGWRAVEALKSKKFDKTKILCELKTIGDWAIHRVAKEENVAAILSCETEAEVRELLSTVSVTSMLMTAQRAIFKLGGEVPEWVIGRDAAGRLAKQVMRAKLNS